MVSSSEKFRIVAAQGAKTPRVELLLAAGHVYQSATQWHDVHPAQDTVASGAGRASH